MHVALRNRISAAFATLTAVVLASALLLSPGTEALMPGPLASVHGAIETCNACHSRSGSGNVSWIHGLIAGDPLADSKACLVCHKMPETAFNPHGASDAALGQSTKRLRQVALRSSPPLDARLQNAAFPMSRVVARDLYCATCHQEHQGTAFKLNAITNEQCRSCHAVKFDSFEGGHPELESYPFNRRTRLVFDHRGHFDRHFPEIAKKGTGKRIPDTCSACHDSRGDPRIMAVAKFDDTCASCHLDQITGKERASGPKGVAFLTLPGIDLATLAAKKAKIGEWPEGSEATLTPFMAMMLGRDERGRQLLRSLAGVNLQDLSKASDHDIKAVSELAWAIKRLYYTLLTSKGSGVLAGLDSGGAPLGPALVADLTASLPHDVIASAQREWLPHLAEELGKAPLTDAPEPAPPAEAESTAQNVDAADDAETPESSSNPDDTPAETSTSEAEPDNIASDAVGDVTSSFAAPVKSRLDPPPCSVSIFGACLVTEEKKDSADATVSFEVKGEVTEGNRETSGEIRIAAADDPSAPAGNAQRDELLFPTEKELESIKAHYKAAGQPEPKRAAPSEGGGVGPAEVDAAPASTESGSAGGAEGSIDPESWADYGGWYRQDYTIYYSPVGHRDRFLYAWLKLASRSEATDGAGSAAVFETLTAQDAPGACTKCHSIDDEMGTTSRRINFAPLKAESKQGCFTVFSHEPHLSVVGERGCLTCHDLGKAKTAATETSAAKSESAYLASYAQGDAMRFAPEFGQVKKETCQSCHTAGEARQDCLLCHAYHVDGVAAPITSTKLPVQ